MHALKAYPVWDAPTRWFHWINALCVMGLAAVGLGILNAGGLGVSTVGKVSLKTLHVWTGYLFALNLAWRIVWAFAGGRYARWGSILPGGRGYFQAVRTYVKAFLSGRPQHYLGHNPVGRLGVAALLLLVAVQALTGLLLAGTDLFYPPVGYWIAHWVAAPDVDPATLVPYAPEMYDKAAYTSMRAFRNPFIAVHIYNFYLLVLVALIHVAGVVVTEVREGGSLISAMFTGRKILSGHPVDEEQISLAHEALRHTSSS